MRSGFESLAWSQDTSSFQLCGLEIMSKLTRDHKIRIIVSKLGLKGKAREEAIEEFLLDPEKLKQAFANDLYLKVDHPRRRGIRHL